MVIGFFLREGLRDMGGGQLKTPCIQYTKIGALLGDLSEQSELKN